MTASTRSPRGAASALALLLLTAWVPLTACARGTTTASGPDSAVSGTATTRPGPTAGTTPTGNPPSGCVGGSVELTVHPGDNPPPLCLRVGATLHITASSSPYQPWQPLTSSTTDIVGCDTTVGADGTVSAVCHARQTGTAVLTATTGAFSGDPHGPPQYRWQLTVRVQP
jgi:hypothetical protein